MTYNEMKSEVEKLTENLKKDIFTDNERRMLKRELKSLNQQIAKFDKKLAAYNVVEVKSHKAKIAIKYFFIRQFTIHKKPIKNEANTDNH